MTEHPNLVFVFADQWRYQDVGYTGNPDLSTPFLDAMAAQSIRVPHMISSCPVCCPFRGTLMTGQNELTHGVFLNDLRLAPRGTTLAEAFSAAGYHTSYIGKWHLDGPERSAFVESKHRLGFRDWKGFNCSHDYNESFYYEGEDTEKKTWQGYDAFAQTDDAVKALEERGIDDPPIALFLSWGPPHNPYHTAPQEYRERWEGRSVQLRPNVPDAFREEAEEWYRGYYAHIEALDACVGRIQECLELTGRAENTIFVFTSDHGDMLRSHGEYDKQRPWDESIRVPFIMRHDAVTGGRGRDSSVMVESADLMPTLLGLCGVEVPEGVEGRDLSRDLTDESGSAGSEDDCALIRCPVPFGNYQREKHGGREYRGVRTRRYTYVRDLNGPWLLYDNWTDPFQLDNLVSRDGFTTLRVKLDALLSRRLQETGDEFLPGEDYVKRWDYEVDATNTVRFTW